MKSCQIFSTYGGEDSEGEEAALDVVPVVGEPLVDDIDSSRGGITDHYFIL